MRRLPPEVRDGCPRTFHDTPSAAKRGCTCPGAQRRLIHYRKLQRAGRIDSMVSARGVARRLRALACMGWTQRALGAELGVTNSVIFRWQNQDRNAKTAMPVTYKRVDALYRRLWDKDGGSEQARRRARQRGWLPPLAWDDIDHDEDPPEVVKISHHGKRGIDLAEVDFLLSCGESLEQIAIRLGVDVESIDRYRWVRRRGEVAS